MVDCKHIIFPGRFQPISNAHIVRINWILNQYPISRLTIVIGDTGELNSINFLTVEERRNMFNVIIGEQKWENVDCVVVEGCEDGVEWGRRVVSLVPSADSVVSDNPFVFEPLKAIGFYHIEYVRSGVSCAEIRSLGFSEWNNHIPESEWKILNELKIWDRIARLPMGSRYPFCINR